MQHAELAHDSTRDEENMSRFKRHMVRCLGGNPQRTLRIRTWRGISVAILFAAILVPMSPKLCQAQSQQDSSPGAERSPQGVAADGTAGLERKLAAVYERVSPAVVRIDGRDGNASTGGTGVIVTADGHVLLGPIPAGVKLTFQLPDGRRATGVALGWSEEWNVGMAKIDGPGPWPHATLAKSDRVHAGQPVVVLTHSLSDGADILPQPLFDLDWVNRSAPGLWFMTADKNFANWRRPGIAFDLDGGIVGVGSTQHSLGATYVESNLIRTLWNDLAASRNLDQERLQEVERGAGDGPIDKEHAAKSLLSGAAQEKVNAATVRIRRGPDDSGCSGTIVTADALIATCAHHNIMPGTKVLIGVPGGRDVAGVVVGINLMCDIGLVQITEPGPFAFVEMGDSCWLRPGDPCIFAGYGPVSRQARQPQVRASSVVAPPPGRWSHLLRTDAAIPFVGGDSGGGVFDADARLVAIHKGFRHSAADGTVAHTNPRVELFRKHADELRAPFEILRESPLASTEAQLQRAADKARLSVVEVLSGEKLVALGIVVGADGRILTKASALSDTSACRLPDGRILPATVIKTVREHDVALLEIDAQQLPIVEWSQTGDPLVGTPVAIAAVKTPPINGFVSHPALSLPAERGHVRAVFRDGDHGLEVIEVYRMPTQSIFANFGPEHLEIGDVVLSIDGHLTPTLETYQRLLDSKQGNPIAISGDAVQMVVRRDGKQIEFRELLGPPTVPRFAGQSPRCSGFPRVYNVAAVSDTSLCGSPVVDHEGRAIGVAIAWRHKGWLLVLPAATVKTMISE